MRSRGYLKKFFEFPHCLIPWQYNFDSSSIFFLFITSKSGTIAYYRSQNIADFNSVQPFQVARFPYFNYVQTFIFAFVIAFRNIKFGSHNFSTYYANVPSRSIQYPFTFYKFQLHILLFQNISIFFQKRSTPCIILLCCLHLWNFPVKFLQIPNGITR